MSESYIDWAVLVAWGLASVFYGLRGYLRGDPAQALGEVVIALALALLVDLLMRVELVTGGWEAVWKDIGMIMLVGIGLLGMRLIRARPRAKAAE